jgi:hypothetical protein
MKEYALADGGRNIVAGYAEVRTHVLPSHPAVEDVEEEETNVFCRRC